jgi:hypothetical protein
MFHSFKTATLMTWLQTLAGLSFACGMTAAQDFAMRVANPNPLGFGNFVPSSMDLAEAAGTEAGIKGAFLYGMGVNTEYDSNIFLSETDEEDEISLFFQPWLSYTTDPEGGATFVFNANYRPTGSIYLNNSDFNELNQSADVSLSWTGSRTDVTAFASYQELSGTDRLTGSFSSGAVFAGGLRASRQIAPRTSLNGSLSYSQSEYDSGDEEGTQVLSGSFGGLWAATERTSIGSSVCYSQTESDNTGTRDAWSLLAELRYRAGERVWLSASLGPQFTSDSESGENDVTLSGNISARYIINERWSWTNSFGTGTIASPSDTGYLVNNYNFTTGLEHQLLRGSINGGLSFDYSDYQSVADVLVERENEENMSLFLAYSRDLWSERVIFNSSVRYRFNNGDRDWSQWVLSAGLNIQF